MTPSDWCLVPAGIRIWDHREQIGEAVGNFAEGAWNTVEDTAGDVYDTAQDTLGDAADWAGDALSSLNPFD